MPAAVWKKRRRSMPCLPPSSSAMDIRRASTCFCSALCDRGRDRSVVGNQFGRDQFGDFLVGQHAAHDEPPRSHFSRPGVPWGGMGGELSKVRRRCLRFGCEWVEHLGIHPFSKETGDGYRFARPILPVQSAGLPIFRAVSKIQSR
jgi:hypothetical protein